MQILQNKVLLCLEIITQWKAFKISQGFYFLFFLLLVHFSFSQKADTAKNSTHFSGSISVTNNGISLVPTFSP